MNSKPALVLGLITGAVGIAILWAAGVEFPTAVPPGIVILLTGAGVVSAFRTRWADALGAFLGVFVIVGFVLSGIFGSGFDNLLGRNGGLVALGQIVQLLGVTTASLVGSVRAARPQAQIRPVR